VNPLKEKMKKNLIPLDMTILEVVEGPWPRLEK